MSLRQGSPSNLIGILTKNCCNLVYEPYRKAGFPVLFVHHPNRESTARRPGPRCLTTRSEIPKSCVLC